MKRKGKIWKIFLTVFVLGLSCLAAAACHAKVEEDDKEYTYTNPDPGLAQTDPGMTVDGNLDEEIWDDVRWLESYYGDVEPGITVKTTGWLGEEGVYFAAEVDDTVLAVNDKRYAYNNSGIEFRLASPDARGIGGNGFEFTIDAGGRASLSRHYAQSWIPMHVEKEIAPRYAAQGIGADIMTDGCTGYTVELFVPYEILKLEEKPEYIRMTPSLLRSNNMAVDAPRLLWYDFALQDKAGYRYDLPETYYKFGSEGFIPEFAMELYGTSDLSQADNAAAGNPVTLATDEQHHGVVAIQTDRLGSQYTVYTTIKLDEFKSTPAAQWQDNLGIAIARKQNASDSSQYYAMGLLTTTGEPGATIIGKASWSSSQDNVTPYGIAQSERRLPSEISRKVGEALLSDDGLNVAMVREGTKGIMYAEVDGNWTIVNAFRIDSDAEACVAFIVNGNPTTYFNTRVEAGVGITTGEIAAETLFIGDSYVDTSFWSDFETAFPTGAENRGVGGTRVAYWTAMLPDLQALYGADTLRDIVVHITVNDINGNLDGGLPDEENVAATVAALKDMFEKYHAAFPNARIHWIRLMPNNLNDAAHRFELYCQVTEAVEEYIEEGKTWLTVVDTGVTGTPGPDVAHYFLSDGLHLNLNEGYVLWTAAIKASLGLRAGIVAEPSENGTITVSDPSPVYNDPLTVTITPEDGYALGSFTVNGTSIALSDLENNDAGAYTYIVEHVRGNMSFAAAFVENKAVTVSGTVVLARDGNTLPGEGATVKLFGAGDTLLQTTVNADGSFSVNNVPAGGYTLRVEMPDYAVYEEDLVVSSDTEVSDIELKYDYAWFDRTAVDSSVWNISQYLEEGGTIYGLGQGILMNNEIESTDILAAARIKVPTEGIDPRAGIVFDAGTGMQMAFMMTLLGDGSYAVQLFVIPNGGQAWIWWPTIGGTVVPDMTLVQGEIRQNKYMDLAVRYHGGLFDIYVNGHLLNADLSFTADTVNGASDPNGENMFMDGEGNPVAATVGLRMMQGGVEFSDIGFWTGGELPAFIGPSYWTTDGNDAQTEAGGSLMSTLPGDTVVIATAKIAVREGRTDTREGFAFITADGVQLRFLLWTNSSGQWQIQTMILVQGGEIWWPAKVSVGDIVPVLSQEQMTASLAQGYVELSVRYHNGLFDIYVNGTPAANAAAADNGVQTCVDLEFTMANDNTDPAAQNMFMQGNTPIKAYVSLYTAVAGSEFTDIAITLRKKAEISCAPAEHGSVELSDDAPYIYDELTITLKPESGYTVTSLIINGKAVQIEEIGDGIYACTVTVTESMTIAANFTAEFSQQITGKVTLRQADGTTETAVGAEVSLTGAQTYTGTVSDDGTVAIADVEAGTYELTVTLDGYTAYSDTVILDENNAALGDILLREVWFGNAENWNVEEFGSSGMITSGAGGGALWNTEIFAGDLFVSARIPFVDVADLRAGFTFAREDGAKIEFVLYPAIFQVQIVATTADGVGIWWPSLGSVVVPDWSSLKEQAEADGYALLGICLHDGVFDIYVKDTLIVGNVAFTLEHNNGASTNAGENMFLANGLPVSVRAGIDTWVAGAQFSEILFKDVADKAWFTADANWNTRGYLAGGNEIISLSGGTLINHDVKGTNITVSASIVEGTGADRLGFSFVNADGVELTFAYNPKTNQIQTVAVLPGGGETWWPAIHDAAAQIVVPTLSDLQKAQIETQGYIELSVCYHDGLFDIYAGGEVVTDASSGKPCKDLAFTLGDAASPDAQNMFTDAEGGAFAASAGLYVRESGAKFFDIVFTNDVQTAA